MFLFLCRIINTSFDSLISVRAGDDGGYVSSKRTVFGFTRDLGRMSVRLDSKINGVLPSAASRMSDMPPVIKRITH